MKGFYTTKEAATALGVTVGRVRQMIIDGLITTDKVGRDHLIPAVELEKARARKTTRGPEPRIKPEEATATMQKSIKKKQGG